jgi:hypothetical protein
VLPGGGCDVLRAKWLGSLFWCRWPALALIAFWVLAALTGTLAAPALPLLLLAGAAHVGFLVSAGLYLSVRARGTGRAVLGVALVALACCLLPRLASDLWAGLSSPALRRAVPGLGPLLEHGLAPPAVWWRLTTRAGYPGGFEEFVGVPLGCAVYAWAGCLLWLRARAGLARDTRSRPRT